MRRQYISQHNITDINFIVINAGDLRSRLNYYRLYRLGYFDLYQDYSSETAPEENVWSLLDGAKDDFLIYDRCGQLTYHIPMPYSALRYPFIQIAIESTYTGRHPCNCSADEPTTTAMPSTEKAATTIASTTPTPAPQNAL
ncbi:selenoprotein Pb-like [Strongylocentrotus purpuratus]|uniref:Selenoprotein P N-terminal domain-containing protein n=1 Tax=Strongylocentrotus purpuratus TaxID=7668 RepID=A0A7M7T0B2_STRPU|nr:selenoprotein Pb-like [Strongylocentrotus purpuratus]